MDEVVDGLEIGGPGGGAKTRGRRRQYRGFSRQKFEKACIRLEGVKAVEEEERGSSPAPYYFEFYVTNPQPLGVRQQRVGHAPLPGARQIASWEARSGVLF